MLGHEQYTQPEFKPSSGRITYTRWMGANYVVSGKVIGEREIKVRRHNAVVTEYLVEPAAGWTNLSKHIVDESEVVKLEPVCPDCGGHGFTSIRGDEAVNCKRCNPMTDDSEVF